MEMLSLYDYLGHAAGGTLGKEVADAAARAKVGFETKEVSNPKYTGTIMMYPKYFLDEYFKAVQEKNLASLYEDDDDDDLPF